MTTPATAHRETNHQRFYGVDVDRVMRIEGWIVTALALLFLVLLVVTVVTDLPGNVQRKLTLAQYLIWMVLAADFFLRLSLAQSKWDYIRRNWFSALALVFPPFRILHAIRAVALVSNAGRGSHELKHLLRAGSATYVLTLSGVVVLVCAAGMYSLEAGVPGANIVSFNDALWWAAATVTTIGCEKYPVTEEGRGLAVILMIYALAFAGYVTATLAVLLLGQNQPSSSPPPSPPPVALDTGALQAQLVALQQQVQALTDQLTAANGRVTAPSDQSTGTPLHEPT